jgi:Raf kinase inhibitor-like YbhB/YbcL family protein
VRLVLLACALLLAACSRTPAPPSAPAGGGLTVTSPDFGDGSAIPSGFTCAGGGHRPELAWSGVSAADWAIVVDDPDAPGGDFYHWIVVDVPGAVSRVASSLPAGARELRNSAGSTGWTAPCPPSGTHHYRFTVYALKAPTGLPADASVSDAFDRISAAATAQGRLTGLVTHTG